MFVILPSPGYIFIPDMFLFARKLLDNLEYEDSI